MLIPVILGVSVVIFTIMYFTPGDAARIILGSTASQAQIDALKDSLGLNDPYLVQLARFLKQMFIDFDLGTSYLNGAEVMRELIIRLPRTAILAGFCMLSVREQEFVEAAKAIDCSSLRIMFRHVLPNSLAPIIITTSMGVGRMIMESSGLSYLGLGIQEPAAEWGAMLSLAKTTMRYYPYQVIVPGIAIALVILAFNLMGDGLRDALDPKLKS